MLKLVEEDNYLGPNYILFLGLIIGTKE